MSSPMQMSSRGDAVIWSGPRWTVRAVLSAALFTAAVFIALPYLELVASKARPQPHLVSVERAALPPPPPERWLLPPDITRTTPVAQPTLAPPASRVPPPTATMDLTPSLDDVQGDFALDFAVSGLDKLADQLVIFDIEEVDRPPTPLVQLEPVYPREAQLRHIGGEVVAEFVVDATGAPREVVAISSRPGQLFVGSAIRAIQRWRFEPGLQDGKPVAVRVRQRVTFNAP